MLVAVQGAPDCVISAATTRGIKTGESVYIGVCPEDVQILRRWGLRCIERDRCYGSTVSFIGERIEYQVEAEGQRAMMIYESATARGGRQQSLADAQARTDIALSQPLVAHRVKKPSSL
jgi:hypothetical protein